MINWWVVAGSFVVYGALARVAAAASGRGAAARVDAAASRRSTLSGTGAAASWIWIIVVGAAGATATATLSTILFLLRVVNPWSGFAWGALLGFSFAAGPVLLLLGRHTYRSDVWPVGLMILTNSVAGALLIVMR